jgi:O-antigen ligase
VQRLSGTGKLLWLVEPRIHKTAESQFGPYAYRSNAAQYLNLIWPACLGFWWTLHRSGAFKRWAHHTLLLCALVTAAAPIISTSRGGAFVALAQIVGASFILIAGALSRSFARYRSARTALLTLLVLGCFSIGSIWLGLHFGGRQLSKRMTDLTEGYESRERTYEIARGMVRDFPVFGTGPGTFDPLFQMYRISPEEYWPVQLHNDWLETRVTFGWLGSGLIAAAFLIAVGRWFLPGGIHGGRRFTMLLWLALLGCMVHARFDFPFQIYSIVFLFVMLCAILFSVSRRGETAR